MRKNENAHHVDASSLGPDNLIMQGTKSPTRIDESKKRPTTPLTARADLENASENQSPRRNFDTHDGDLFAFKLKN